MVVTIHAPEVIGKQMPITDFYEALGELCDSDFVGSYTHFFESFKRLVHHNERASAA